VLLNGAPWKGFDTERELIRIEGVKGTIAIEASY
jgi:hypothetical protein